MLNHGCVNGSLHGVNYAAPLPIIGIYTTLASLACLALMLHDIIAGVFAKKRWLPCMYFKLDSLTLTLLGVVTTLPLDLTTSMPGARDQLSKLTGTALVCVFMAFIAPSLGVNEESACFTNMMALSIFVATAGIYVSIQLYTGVIVLFFVENIIMLCLMLLLLLMLWHVCFWIKVQKRLDVDRYNHLLSKGSDSMFERLKLSWLCAYCSNPQYKIGMYPMSAAIGTICLGCAAIVVETTLRSLVLNKVEFCRGDSDYRWSMSCIVIVQIVTVIVGTFAVVARWLALFSRMDLESILVSFLPDDDHVIQRNQTLKAKGLTRYRIKNFFGSIITKIVLIFQVVVLYPQLQVRNLLGVNKKDNKLEYFGETAASGYIVRKALDDMIRLMNQVAKSESESPYLPSKYLCLNSPSQYLHLHSMKIKDGIHEIEVSSLKLALLVKIAQASLPKDRLENVLNTFAEAKEVVQFIDKIIQPKSTEMNEKLAYARAVWRGGDLTCLLPGYTGPGADHMAAVDTIKKLKATLRSSGDIWPDLGNVVNFIDRKSYSSMNELCKAIEELFGDMLHALYAQLMNAIYKCLCDKQAEEFEESIRVAMEFLFKIGSLKCQNNWVFPAEMSCIVEDEPPKSGYTGAWRMTPGVTLPLHSGYTFRLNQLQAPTLSAYEMRASTHSHSYDPTAGVIYII